MQTMSNREEVSSLIRVQEAGWSVIGSKLGVTVVEGSAEGAWAPFHLIAG
jgi:hypothetical protein